MRRSEAVIGLCLWCCVVTVSSGAQDTPAKPMTPAETKVAELEKALAEAQAALEAAKTHVQQVEADLAAARLALTDERIERARTGDPAALRTFLDTLDDGLTRIAFSAARALSGPGVDLARAVAAVAEKWAKTPDSATGSRLKTKFCWLLGRNGSAEAAAQLRHILASEKDATVLANAARALGRFEHTPEHRALLQKHAADERQITYVIGDYPRSFILGDYVSDLLKAWQNVEPATVPLDVVSYATFVSAGFEWRIRGDTNRNCRVDLAWRKQGEAVWRPAQPLMRVESGVFNQYKQDAGNLLAGSLFFLEPGTTYEVKLTLSDPDGGGAERTVTVTTRTEPQASKAGATYHVVPGEGGGTGTAADPFRGLEATQTAAKPGDVFLLGPGTYKGPLLARVDGEPDRPIFYRGADAARVTLDAGGVERGVNFNSRKHLFLENVTVTNARILVAVMNAEGIVVRHCVLTPLPGGAAYVGILGQGHSRDFTITDNVIRLGTPWERRRRSSYGISLNGPGHVVCHNHISGVWDAVSLASNDPSIVTSNVDIYGNVFERCTDDGVEADQVRHNIRVFHNRILNSGSALSSQPSFGGPTYYLFNEIYNCRIKPYKYHVTPTGMIACHNTSVCSRNGWGGGGWRNVRHRNNLVLGGLSPTVDTEGTGADLDYNGYNHLGDFLIVLGRVKYRSLAESAEDGQEKHGVIVSITDFVKAALPHHPEWTYQDQYGRPYAADEIDLRLKPTSTAVDAGEVLANINDGFAGKAPDLGCYELGKPVPHYGPRP
ncbi:MAG TPA: right-handed parallel beta-helix repeat-containing protein [Planctomycetota bacterium]|nr:right-handed parallel beta-helix repeat-containing protein [Planctomycetota bacterium]